jgi:hypothetical protein
MNYEEAKLHYAAHLKALILKHFPELSEHNIEVDWNKRKLYITPVDYPEHYNTLIDRCNSSLGKFNKMD